MANDSQLAVAALVVALVALLTTVSQVLSQLFATADGYRRCQSSIMGAWAKATHRKFRWADLRFETLYTTPRFALFPYNGKTMSTFSRKGRSMPLGIPYHPLDGSKEMIQKTYATPLSEDLGTSVFHGPVEMASWVRLIDALHLLAADTRDMSKPIKSDEKFGNVNEYWPNYLIPMVTQQEHSWDFVPPDVIRPLAILTLHDLAVFARRLDMEWKIFAPSEGSLHADGNGHTVDSTTVRSVGTVAQFGIRDPLHALESKDRLYVPSLNSDKMGFGILPGEGRLYLSDTIIGTPADCVLRMFDIDRTVGEDLKAFSSDSDGWTPGFSDIIGFAAPMIRLPNSTIIRVPAPAQYVYGLTKQEEGFIVFHRRLRDLIAERESKGEPVTSQLRWVLRQYEDLLERYGKRWQGLHALNSALDNPSIDFLDALQSCHEATTEYFVTLRTASNGAFSYKNLMHSHITHAVTYLFTAQGNIEAGRARDTYGCNVPGWIVEGAHVYFDNIPKVAKSMKEKGYDDEGKVEEAWCTMMLRAFLWHRSHEMVQASRVPSQHWGSRLPVYIG